MLCQKHTLNGFVILYTFTILNVALLPDSIGRDSSSAANTTVPRSVVNAAIRNTVIAMRSRFAHEKLREARTARIAAMNPNSKSVIVDIDMLPMVTVLKV